MVHQIAEQKIINYYVKITLKAHEIYIHILVKNDPEYDY